MTKKIKDTEQAWDARTLGAEAEFVGVADASHELVALLLNKCHVVVFPLVILLCGVVVVPINPCPA